MADEYPDIPIYESLSDDEADMEENANGNTMPGSGNTEGEGSVQPEKQSREKQPRGSKRKWSKGWDTFDYIKGVDGEGDISKCKKCGYSLPYNSSFGTGNMLKHQKTCTRSRDVRHMIISSSQGSMTMQNTKFDPAIFRDMITDAVDTIPTYTIVCGSHPGTSLQNQGIDVMKEFDALDCDHGTTIEKNELDRYLEEKRLNRALEIDVLDYWSTNQFRFPNLALMARDVLTIPISTIASESAFSIGGRVLDQYRSCLAYNIVQSLICTRDWRFNEQEVYHNYPLEELTQDVMKLDINADADNDV
ncbi:hypothetical protein AgCh_033764 [Apium graveolens]